MEEKFLIDEIKGIDNFLILKAPLKLKGLGQNEIVFNEVFTNLFATIELKKYFSYFKFNLIKLQNLLKKEITGLEKELSCVLKTETETLIKLIEKKGIKDFETFYTLSLPYKTKGLLDENRKVMNLKTCTTEYVEKIGKTEFNNTVEAEKRGLLIGIEGMLEIKFGMTGLELFDEITKITEITRLYSIKDAILRSRNINDLMDKI